MSEESTIPNDAEARLRQEAEPIAAAAAVAAHAGEQRLKDLAGRLPGGNPGNYLAALIDFFAAEYGWGLDVFAGLDNRQMVAFVEQALRRRTAIAGGSEAGGGKPAEDRYVTRDQIAALVQRNKDTVADWFNDDRQAPTPAVEGGGGKRHEYLWHEVRPWLEKKTGRKLPERFPELPPR
jgi:hypothetical protein